MDHNDPHPLPSEESLDEWIRESLRQEPDPASVERLAGHWRVESRRQTRRRLVWRVVPLAAAASLAAFFFFVSWNDRPEEFSTADNTQEPSVPEWIAPDPIAIDWQAHTEQAHTEPTEPIVLADNLSAGRAPTAYERILFVAATRFREPSKPPSAPPSVASSPKNPSLENNVDQLVADLDADVKAIGDLQRWGEIIRKTEDADIRYALMQRLLQAESQAALVVYLSLVQNETLRDEALGAGAELQELPVEGFIKLLGHDDESVRLAAAVVLGRLNRCEMTAALIDRIQHQPSDSTEAWFALFACRCDAADTFLVHATQSPQLLGQFNNARLQWAQLSY